MADTSGALMRGRARPARPRRSQMPLGFIEPELATLTDAMPEGPDWVHEVKFDGYRTLTIIDDGRDWTDKYRALADRLKDLDVKAPCSTARSSRSTPMAGRASRS